MASNSGKGKDGDGDRGLETLRADLVAVFREAIAALDEKFERRFRQIEQRLEPVIEQPDPVVALPNRNGNEERGQARDGVAHGDPPVRPNFGNQRAASILEDDSEEEDDLWNIGNNRFGGRGNNQYGRNQGNQYGDGPQEFKLRVDLPNFSGNLSIEDFID